MRAALLLAGGLFFSTYASAEVVMVKYRGPVDLAPFKCSWFADSTVVKRICYDQPKQYLLVSLKGVYYHYCGLPEATLRAWLRADSMGRHYSESIKGNFDCRITPPPTY